MLKKFRQSGFSLLEVMMAVVVLMMGMVFVASMFPVGLHNSRINVERTINSIEANNAAVMAELIIENNRASDKTVLNRFGFSNPENIIKRATFNEYNFDDFFNSRPSVGTSVNEVHFIPQPNIFYESDSAFIADIEFESDLSNSLYNLTFTSYQNTSVWAGSLYPPFSFMATHYTSGTISIFDDHFQNYVIGNLSTTYPNCLLNANTYNGDIGKICCPAVGMDTQGVAELVTNGYSYGEAIHILAKDSRYSFAIAYKEIGSNNTRDPYTFNIFIFKLPTNARYAMQDPANAQLQWPGDPYKNGISSSQRPIPFSPSDLGADYDCRFPLPWMVYLDNPVVSNNLLGGTDNDKSFFYMYDSVAAQLIRPGSYLIDSDPEFVIGGTFTQKPIHNESGMILRVDDVVYDDDNGRYIIMLDRAVSDEHVRNSLYRFWVFPPAVVRDPSGNFIEFMDEQPVIDVIKKTYRY